MRVRIRASVVQAFQNLGVQQLQLCRFAGVMPCFPHAMLPKNFCVATAHFTDARMPQCGASEQQLEPSGVCGQQLYITVLNSSASCLLDGQASKLTTRRQLWTLRTASQAHVISVTFLKQHFQGTLIKCDKISVTISSGSPWNRCTNFPWGFGEGYRV